MFRLTTLVLAGLCASEAVAGPVERAWVPPDATWVVHVDLEGLFASRTFATLARESGVDLDQLQRELHREILEELEDEADMPPRVVEMWRDVDFRALEDLRSLTAFGRGVEEEPDALIIRTSDTIDQIVAGLAPVDGVTVADGDSVTFVSLAEPGEGGDVDDQQVAAIRKDNVLHERTVVVAETTARLIETMERYARQSAAGGDAGPAWLDPRPGAFVFVHATTEALPGLNDEGGQFLSMARDVRIEMGESAGEMYIDALVGTDDAQMSTNLAAIAHGLLAAGRIALMHEEGGAELASVFDGLRISARGTTVAVEFRMEVDEVAHTLRRLERATGKRFRPGVGVDDGEAEVRIRIEDDDEDEERR